MVYAFDYYGGKFLAKDHVPQPRLLKIREAHPETMQNDQGRDEQKIIVTFEGEDRGLVLNQTNLRILAEITGSGDTDDWPGHEVVLYTDENISFGGRIVGGLRIRAPKKQATTRKAPPPRAPARNLSAEDTQAVYDPAVAPDDEIPF